MAGRRIGEVFVAVEADTSMFRTQTVAGVTKALAGISPSVPVSADTRQARTQIDALRARMIDLNKQLATVKIGADGKPAESVVRRLQLELKKLADTVAHITMEADTSKLDLAIAREELNLAKLQEQASGLKMDADTKALVAKIAVLQAQIFHWRAAIGKPGQLDVDVRAWRAKVAQALAEIKVLKAGARDVVLDADATRLIQAIVASEAAIAGMKAELADLKFGGKTDLATLGKVETDLLGLEEAARKLNPEVAALNRSLVQGGGAWGRFGLGALTARVALFGGLTAVSGFHIALDVIIESLAVIIPALATATAGLLAFGLAGSDAAIAVANRLKNVHTVADAFNTTIPPMTSNLENLHKVVRPQVWQLYGDAISLAGAHQGLFNKLATDTGGVIDRFAAKLTILVTGGSAGLTKFLASGQRDLAQFGRIISNLGNAFGKLIQVSERTGIAEALLSIVNAAAKLFDLVTKLPLPLLTAIIAFHGIYLWSGLAATGVLRLLGPLSQLAKTAAGTKLAGRAVEDLAAAGGGGSIKTLGATFRDLGTNLKALPGRVLALGKSFVSLVVANPWVAIGVVAVAALVGLYLWLGKSKSAVDRFNDSINTMVSRSTNFTIINNLASGLGQTSAKLATTTGALNNALKVSGGNLTALQIALAASGSSSANATQDFQRLTDEHQKLAGQLLTVTTRLAGVTQEFGTKGLSGAMALATLAGVKVSTLLKGTSSDWAIALQQIRGVVQGYANMGVGANQLGSALNVLTIAQSSQLTNMQTLNNAFDNFTKIVSGPISGFLSFANTLKRFQTDAGVAGASISGLGTGFSGVSKKVTDASLQLQSDFQDTFNSATQMADAFRLTGTSADKQISAIKDWVQILIPMAGSNKAAAAEVSALAQEAGGPATTNLKSLAKWAGSVKDPLGKAQVAAQDAAISFFNMSEDAKKLGAALSQDLAADSAKAAENAVGLQGAMDIFAKDIQNVGTSISTTNSDRKRLIGDLAQVGIVGPQASAIVGAISSQLQNVKGPINNAAAAFETFAGKGGKSGLGLTTAQADLLWKKLNEQNLTILGGKADITKVKFEQFANKALDLTTAQADVLWKHLQMQYLDAIGGKADTTKSKFEQLAKEGLNLDIAQADALWKKLQEQQLDEVGRKSDTTRTKFEQLAKQIGVNTQNADLWFAALRSIPSSVSTKITVDGKGNVVVNGVAISPGAFFSPHAQGGFISGGVPNRDSVPGMLMPGEVVVPTAMVQQGAVDHLRGMLPGFNAGGMVGSAQAGTPQGYASGGAVRVGNTGNLNTDFGKNLVTTVNDITGRATAQVTENATKALAAWANNSLGGSGSAIVRYADSFLNKIPYVFGGNSLSSGIDCSGFTQQVYGHFGIHAPRTSEAQYAWANKHSPVPGGLAFYVSPGGGPPPGHVAIVQDAGTVISQGGGMGPVIQSLRFLPLMGTGVPPGGLPTPPSGGAGNNAIGAGAGPAGAQAWMRAHLGDYGWGQGQWSSLLALWNGESGWRWNAQNPHSPAYGIPQADPGSKMATVGADWRTNAVTQMRWGAEYIRGTPGYGSPSVAYSKWLSRNPHWYAAGGLIGSLASAETAEKSKYFGLEHAFATGPAKYRTKLTVQELGTLAARQASELSAYKAVTTGSMTKAELSHLGATARAESIVAADQALNRTPGGHPGFAKDLRSDLAVLNALSRQPIPAGGGSGGGGTGDAQLRAKLVKSQAGVKAKYYGLEHSFAIGPAKYRTKVTQENLASLTAAEALELAAFKAVVTGTMTKAELSKLGASARSEYKVAADQALNRTPGGHPGFAKDLRSFLAQVSTLTGTKIPGAVGGGTGTVSGPPLPPVRHIYGGDVSAIYDKFGPILAAALAPFSRGGAVSYDKGGMLQPGLTMAYNGTGRPEPVGAQAVNVSVEIGTSGSAEIDQALLTWLRKTVKVKGGGNVQRTFGAPGTVSGSNTWRTG